MPRGRRSPACRWHWARSGRTASNTAARGAGGEAVARAPAPLPALPREPQGAALPGLPLTLVAKRPDGVEYRRAQVEDQGLGGRAFSLPILAGAQHGTWRVVAYTDPKGSAV